MFNRYRKEENIIKEINDYQDIINILSNRNNNLYFISNVRDTIERFKRNKSNIKEKFEKTIKEKQDYEIKYNKLNKEYQDKIKEIEELKKKIKELKSLNDSEIIALKRENKKLKGDLESMKEEKDNIKRDKTKEIKDLQKQLKEKQQKFDGAITHFEKLSNVYDKLQGVESQLKEKEIENKRLISQNEELLSNTSTKEKYRNKDLNNFYDIIIEIDSINTLNRTGWKINYNDQRKEIYNKVIGMETVKIGVLGLNNVGKSFILSLLSGMDLPTGWSIETRGISIKYSEGEQNTDEGICLLDSAGFETPLLNGEIPDFNKENENNENKHEVDKNIAIMDKLQEIAKDKGQTERFIEELIIALSDMLILVVGKLTRREQNLITRIKDIVHEKENTYFRSIIIIHNLAQYNELTEVENHINNVLKKSATFQIYPKKVTGIKEYEDRLFFTENDGTDHFIMARKGSNAGNYYNELTIRLIRNKYNDCKSRKQIDIPQEIINLFSKMSKDIIEDNIEIKNLHISEDKQTITMSEENKENNIKKKDFKIQKSYIDEMGKYNSISSKYIPKCSYYAYKEKDNYILLLRLEIPGKIENLTASYFKYGKKKTIQIKGIKTKDEFPEMKKKNFIEIQDNRNYDELRFLLVLEQEIELMKETPIDKTEYYEFEFNRNNKDKSSNDYDKDEDEDEDEDEGDKEECEKENDKADEIKKIASGVYILRFYLTQTSWKNLYKKHKKSKDGK